MQTKFQQTLDNHIMAGYQMLSATTADWQRIEQEVAEYANSQQFGVLSWNCADGLRVSRWPGPNVPVESPPLRWQDLNKLIVAAAGQTGDPKAFLDFMVKSPGWKRPKNTVDQEYDAFIVVAVDLDNYFKSPHPTGPGIVTRTALMVSKNQLSNAERRTPMLLLSTGVDHVDKSKPWITPLNYAYPDQAWFADYIRATAADSEVKVDPDPDTVPCIAKGLLGLNERDGCDTLMLAIREHKRVHKGMMRTIYEEKAKNIQRSGILTFMPFESLPSWEHLKGFDNLIEFVRKRSLAYSDEAQQLGLDLPKGVVLIGVPGTGKSQVAFATAAILGLPCVLLDVGAIFDKFVGSSEARITEALKQIEALSGCVLVIDEADKGFRGMADGGGDSGVSSRVFGKILSWLANKNDRTFVIMTMNTTAGIPPELLRPGRFDAMFSTDLPTAVERSVILETHLKKRKVDPAPLMASPQWGELIAATNDYTGAELETGIKEARYTSFAARKSGDPTIPELIEAMTKLVPVAKLDDTRIAEIRSFCASRTIRVSSGVEAREFGGPNAATERKTRQVKTGLN